MPSNILVVFCVAISLLLYKFATSVLTSRRHARAARELGCRLPDRMKCLDPIGIENVLNVLQADKECRFPQFIKKRADEHCERKGSIVSTWRQNVLGSTNFHTVDPENVKAILATQFKDFGLGDARNSNFYPLLGKGIVSLTYVSLR
jgi:hypothetical protein